MWCQFLCAVFTCAALLYGPGYLFFRGIGLDKILALACAPLFATCVYATLPLAYFELHVSCSLQTVVLPAMIVASLAYALRRAWGELQSPCLCVSSLGEIRVVGMKISCDVALPLLYVAVASAVCMWVFVTSLGRADAFFPRFDNQTHLNLIRAFLDSGQWSSLHADVYAASTLDARPVLGDGGFYPAAWHCVVTLVCLASGASLTVAINAAVAVVGSAVFPLCIYVLLRALFPAERAVIACGALACTGFATWPWTFVTAGPLYPNQLGLSMVFCVLAVVILFVEGGRSPGATISFVATSAISLVSLALSHTSAIFTAYVFLAFYGSWVVERFVGDTFVRRPKSRRIVAQALALVAFWLVVVLAWVALFFAPPLKTVTSFMEKNNAELIPAIGSVALLKFHEVPLPQVSMIVAYAVGGVALLCASHRGWVVLPALYFAVASVVTLVGADGVSHWLGGFWYTDKRRLFANYTVFLIPLAAWGWAELRRFIYAKTQRGSILRKTCALALCGLAVLVYIPSVSVPQGGSPAPVSGLQSMKDKVKACYGAGDTQTYSKREIDFVDQAKRLLPEGSLVANAAPDGSMWAYGINGLNTLFRTQRVDGHTEDAALVREHLCEYASNRAVREAANRLGVTHVLQLDAGVSYADGHWLPQLHEEEMALWAGVNLVDETTPGFTLMLAEDNDMRLYAINKG